MTGSRVHGVLRFVRSPRSCCSSASVRAGQRLERDVRRREMQRAGQRARHGDGPHAGGVRGGEPVGGVLEDHAVGRGDAEPLGGQQKQVRRRFHARHVVARAHRAHQIAQAVTGQPRAHPFEAAARGHGRRQPGGIRLLQPVEHAWPERLVLAPAPVLVAHARHPCLARQLDAGLAQQLGVGIEAVVRAQRVPPLVHRQLAAVIPVDLGPDVEDGRLAVDDQPVEVEDHGTEGHGLYGARPQPDDLCTEHRS